MSVVSPLKLVRSQDAETAIALATGPVAPSIDTALRQLVGSLSAPAEKLALAVTEVNNQETWDDHALWWQSFGGGDPLSEPRGAFIGSIDPAHPDFDNKIAAFLHSANSLGFEHVTALWCGDSAGMSADLLRSTAKDAPGIQWQSIDTTLIELMTAPTQLGAVMLSGPSRGLIIKALAKRLTSQRPGTRINLSKSATAVTGELTDDPSVIVEALTMALLQRGLFNAAHKLWDANLVLRDHGIRTDSEADHLPYAKRVSIEHYLDVLTTKVGRSPNRLLNRRLPVTFVPVPKKAPKLRLV